MKRIAPLLRLYSKAPNTMLNLPKNPTKEQAKTNDSFSFAPEQKVGTSLKVIILAGGYGTRMGEAAGGCPKPMVSVGGEPLLWHIMKIYASYGFEDFVVLVGHKGNIIKQYFQNGKNKEPGWSVKIVETGEKL